MKILKMAIDNFQATQHSELDFNGNSVIIRGDNGTGKTTIYNAYTWLFWDKASNGATGFLPKPKEIDGSDMHNLETSVEAVIELDDGIIKTFRKVMIESWVTKRGEQTPVFSGHTYAYYTDTVPTSKGQFGAAIAAIMEPEKMAILSRPEYFAQELTWNRRREIISEIFGEIAERDIIASTPELAAIGTYLKIGNDQYITVEQFTAIAKEKLKKVSEEIKKLPTQISEAARTIKAFETTPEQREAKKAAIEAKISTLQKEFVSGGESADTISKRKLRELATKRAAMESDFLLAKSQNMMAQRKIIDGFVLDQIPKVETAKTQTTVSINRRKTELSATEALRDKYTKQYNDLKIKEWAGSDCCPTCGQAMPADKLDALCAAFNENKSKELTAITETVRATCSKQIIADHKAVIAILEENYNKSVEDEATLQELLKVEQTKYTEMQKTTFEETESARLIDAQILDIEAEPATDTIGQGNGQNIAAEALAKAKEALSAISNEIYEADASVKQQARVAELEGQQKTAVTEEGRLVKGLYLCDLYTKRKMELISEKINGSFGYVQFRLFKEQINGGIIQDCEVLVPSPDGTLVPYTDANTGGKLNAGLELIDALSHHYGRRMPVFVDNAESVTRPRMIDTQMIFLTVDENAKVLKLDFQN